jgi:predicted RNase H-like nuclease (RuvC/YqgF family)
VSEYDDYEDDQYEQEPERDSNPVKTLRKRGDELARKLKETEARNAELEARLRTTDVQDALKEAGIADFGKVAKLVPASVKPEEVPEWLKEYGDVFGVKPNEASQAGTPTAPPAVDESVQQQMLAMQNVAATGAAPSGKVTDADLKAANTPAELYKLLGIPQP